MRIAAVQRIIGLLLALYSVTLIPPILVSLWYADDQTAIFVTTMALWAGLGLLLWLPVRHRQEELRIRDGFLVVALYWSVLGLAGAIPFWYGGFLDFTAAVFESVSGFTTTGATNIVGIDDLPRSILYYRQQMQWLGGLGVVVLAVAVLPMLGVGGMQLYRAETSRVAQEDKLAPRIIDTARVLWIIYLTLTVLCAAAYWLAGMTPFDAIGHSFTTIATAGYSTHDESIGFYNSAAIETIAIVFMFLGALNFALHFVVWRSRNPLAYFKNPEVRFFAAIILGAALLVTAVLTLTATYDSLTESLRKALFQVVSVITTTGYGTATFAEWPLFVPFLLITLSFIGGCAGSTAGGIKVVRIMLLLKQGGREIHNLVHPRAVYPIKIGGKPVPEEVVKSVWGFYSFYMFAFFILVMAMMGTGLDLESAIGAVVASFNLLGPGLGEVASNFATVGDTTKWIAIFSMILGRLEIFTLLVIFTFVFWRG